MSRIRFLLDENTPHAIRDQQCPEPVEGLLRRKPEMEVLVIGDDMAPALGTPDPELLRWIEREGYCAVHKIDGPSPKTAQSAGRVRGGAAARPSR